MNLDLNVLTNSLVSHALTLGVFDQVNSHTPVGAPPGSGLTLALWLDEVTPVPGFSGLAGTSARMVVQERIYIGAQSMPADAIDPSILNACNQLMAAYSAAFTLEGNVSYVDLMQMKARAAWVGQDPNHYRTMTLATPMVLDDVWPQSP